MHLYGWSGLGPLYSLHLASLGVCLALAANDGPGGVPVWNTVTYINKGFHFGTPVPLPLLTGPGP